MNLIRNQIRHTGRTHSATVIFLHGSGDNGTNLMDWIRILLRRNLEFDHIKLVYPTAPLQPYTPNGGQMSNVWFDRDSISIAAPENRSSMSKIYDAIHHIINDEVRNGIPLERIIVGGFSMGGALALHTGYHLNTNIAGVFACSSFLNHDSVVYESLSKLTKGQTDLPDLLMFHGDRDDLVPIEWGLLSFNKLTKLGVKGNFTTLTDTYHELKRKELHELHKWILLKLPPIEINRS
ncbi:lysophospholipase-like protein 1 [Musca vetustissima]|uniref:lysophospholipase-like protein 1 n=1 Tax=Musca vetustissima TaxID=27455 RepID=UPI002AB6BC2A|nr:lysophospholipase-like protein 1 [Musca vetustissima]